VFVGGGRLVMLLEQAPDLEHVWQRSRCQGMVSAAQAWVERRAIQARAES
jgi:hypothetical protein